MRKKKKRREKSEEEKSENWKGSFFCYTATPIFYCSGVFGLIAGS
jgi:hypothetical protein